MDPHRCKPVVIALYLFTKPSSLPIDNLIRIRRHIHSRPELSGEEQDTARYITEKLEALQPDSLITGLGGYGIAASFDSNNEGPHVGFRCELDGLPIRETGNIEHQSVKKGISHVCGHDGHMAIMLGFAQSLAASRPARGRVTVLFQPAEETGAGAAAVLADQKFDDIRPEFMYALHNVPGMEMHTIGCKAGILTPAVISLKVSFSGRTAHAGEPEKGINPAFAMADLVRHIGNMMTSRNRETDGDFTVAIVEQRLGNHNYGTSAGEGSIGLTMRSHSECRLEALKKDITDFVRGLSAGYMTDVHFDWFESFRAVNNDEKCARIIKDAAGDVGYNYLELTEPFNWGEDFGLYTANAPGAMFALGAGTDTPALHHPDFDFPDELIETGVNMFKTIAEKTTG